MNDIQNLFELIQQRLELMEMFALYKYQQHLPVRDEAIEHKAEALIKQHALTLGLNPQRASEWLRVLVWVSIQLQEDWIKTIQDRPSGSTLALNMLQNELRPKLQAITANILEEIAKSKAILADSQQQTVLQQQFNRVVHNDMLNQAQKNQLFTSLINLVTA